MTFDEIEDARRRLNVSQYELCRTADINPSTYTRILAGSTVPRGRTLRKLQLALTHFERPQAAGGRA